VAKRSLVLLYAAFAALAFFVYGPALHGEFLSDDAGYLTTNPYTQSLTPGSVRVILDPWGDAAAFTGNYAPVHLLAEAARWRVFGTHTTGYHVVNVLGHALCALLLVPLLRRSGLSREVSVFGGLFFLLHPALAEVVAWISQLKTILCLMLGLGALLLHPRRPALAAALFVLAILAKASAAFALPPAAYFAWRRSQLPESEPPRWGWLAVWALAFVLYSSPQIFAFQKAAESPPQLGADAAESLRTVVAIGARYLAMAATSYGASAFQHPPAARSPLDPWWLAGLALGAGIAIRFVRTLRKRHEEAGYWIWAAAGYAPISQLFPFLYPMADRYLYVVLPGLLGAIALAATRFESRVATTGEAPARAPWHSAAAAAMACAVLLGFAVRTHARAAVFRNNTTLMLDSALHYPQGLSANLLRAQGAAQAGDAAGAAEAIDRAAALGFDSFFVAETDPALAPVRQDPRVRAAIGELAGRWIEVAKRRGYAAPRMLLLWAQAHQVRGEWPEAEAVLERALEAPGPLEPELRKQLEEVRQRRAQADRKQLEPPR